MFPGLGGGGFNPKQMASMMRQMGIKSTEIEAKRVVIEKADGSKLVVEQPSVTAIEMQGQKTLQVSGKFVEDGGSGESGAGGKSEEENDVEIIVAQTGVSGQEAVAALEEAGGDLAQAILKLKKE